MSICLYIYVYLQFVVVDLDGKILASGDPGVRFNRSTKTIIHVD